MRRMPRKFPLPATTTLGGVRPSFNGGLAAFHYQVNGDFSFFAVGGTDWRYGGGIRSYRPERRRSDTLLRVRGLGPRQEPGPGGRY